MAVLSLPVADPDVMTEPLFDEDRLLIVPAGHPFYDHDRVSLADLDGQPSSSSRRDGRSAPSSRPCSTSGATSSSPRPRWTAPG